MRRTSYGFGNFGKGFFVPPPPPPDNSAELAQLRAELAALRGQAPAGSTPTEMEQLRIDLAALRAQLAAGMPVQTPAGLVSLPANATQAQLVSVGALTLPGVANRGGEVVQGSNAQTQRELLAQQGQTFFTRSADAPDANLRWDDWRRLAAMLPANFDEAKYLAKNPDVAEAVRKKAMPSGAWHYVMYGMPGCQSNAKDGSKSCDVRSLQGWRRGLNGYSRPTRRPGYLAGYSLWK